MTEYISRGAILAKCAYEQPWGAEAVIAIIKDFPAADVAPVRHGRWLSMDSEKVIAMDDDGCPVDSCRCSECGDWLTGSDEYATRGRYCPNCGADMRIFSTNCKTTVTTGEDKEDGDGDV